MPKVSVIVPIYNVEKYLPKCVDSIINQTLKDIEIILVDDESPDNCPQICDDYAKKDNRIKVIHQKNKWLSGARNSGIEIATGDYLCFVDSDDFIAPEMCEKLYNFTVQNGTDLTMYDHCSVDEEGNILAISPYKKHLGDKRIFNKKDIENIIYPIIISSHAINGAPFKIYKRELFDKGFRFDETLRYGEDYASCLSVFPMANKVGYLEEVLYYYTTNPASIMGAYDPQRINRLIILYELREEFLKKNNLDTEENKKKSAKLLLKLVVEKIFELFSDRNSQFDCNKKYDAKQICRDAELREAISRIKISELETGKAGKLCLLGLKLSNVTLIKLASKIYNR